MIILRQYQQKAVDLAVTHLKSNSSDTPLMILPTGAGKSIIIANIAKEFNHVLVLQPRKEILEQNYAKYIQYYDDASIFSASIGIKEISNVTFATIGSVINKIDQFKHFKIIIIDECHLFSPKEGQYVELFKSINASLLGLSATPYRLSTTSFGNMLKFLTRTRPRVFTSVLYNIDIKDLLAQGYLNPMKYSVVEIIDESKLFVNSTGTDYTEWSVRKLYKEIQIESQINNVVKRLINANRKHILVFTRFVEEAKSCAELLGSQAAWVSGETPKKEREKIINDFKSGKIRVVFNAMIFTVGFDFPELDTIVMARTTLSLSLYYQIVGRALRIADGKGDSWFIDLGKSFNRFGRVEHLIFNNDSRKPAIMSRGKQLTNIYY